VLRTIDDILKKYHLPQVMTVRFNDQSGWLTPLAEEAQALCGANDAIFVVLESGDMNAVAIQDEIEIVGMYAGMFWMLCRIAAVAAERGVFPAMKGEAEPIWAPDPLRSIQTSRTLLQEGDPFVWDIESAGWRDAPERQMLFYLVLKLLFRFVVFHEIGHLRNDHGRRKQSAISIPILMERSAPRLIDPKEAIPSQAREIIADGYAFQKTLTTLEMMLSKGSEFELIQIYRKRLFKNKTDTVAFVLTIINLYFRAVDKSDWKSQPIDRLSHPPAPFRMNAVLALLIEDKSIGLNEKTVIDVIRGAVLSSDALMSVMLDVYPNPNWLKEIQTPAYDSHFKRLFDEFPRWYGRLTTDPKPS
jgi:hypothetical protein